MIGVGSRVICVDDSISGEALIFVVNNMPGWVEKGKTYTVREISDNGGIVTGVLLEEITNPPVWVDLVQAVIEPRFALWRFREIEESVGEEKMRTERARELELV